MREGERGVKCKSVVCPGKFCIEMFNRIWMDDRVQQDRKNMRRKSLAFCQDQAHRRNDAKKSRFALIQASLQVMKNNGIVLTLIFEQNTETREEAS